MHFNTLAVSLFAGSALANLPIWGVGAGAGAEVSFRDYHIAKSSVGVHAGVDVGVAVGAGRAFKCPAGMNYCPWTKACSCPPGLKLDGKHGRCVGEAISGAWPEPSTEVYASKGVPLCTYCAVSPYKIVRYDPAHPYCQASINSIAFVASADLQVEVGGFAGAAIDVNAGCSVGLKSVCAGLAGLYVESSADAVALFNTNAFGLACARSDVELGFSLGAWSKLQGSFCGVGLGSCHFDCVSYCTKGCKNYIDMGAEVEVGAHLGGLVGLCVLPNIILVCNSVKTVVTVAVDGLLCLIGGLVSSVLSTFDCGC